MTCKSCHVLVSVTQRINGHLCRQKDVDRQIKTFGTSSCSGQNQRTEHSHLGRLRGGDRPQLQFHLGYVRLQKLQSIVKATDPKVRPRVLRRHQSNCSETVATGQSPHDINS